MSRKKHPDTSSSFLTPCPLHRPSAQLLPNPLPLRSVIAHLLSCAPSPVSTLHPLLFPACVLKIATEGSGLLSREDRNKNSGLESDGKHTGLESGLWTASVQRCVGKGCWAVVVSRLGVKNCSAFKRVPSRGGGLEHVLEPVELVFAALCFITCSLMNPQNWDHVLCFTLASCQLQKNV